MKRLLLPLLAGVVMTTAPALAFNPQGYGGFYNATVGRPTVTVVTPQYHPKYGYNVVHYPRGYAYGHRRGNWRQRAYYGNPHWGRRQQVVYQQPVYAAPCPPPPPQYGYGYGHPHHPYGY